MSYKEVGDYVVIYKDDFKKYKKAYNEYVSKREYSRNYMRKKYQKDKIENKNKKQEEQEEKNRIMRLVEDEDMLHQLEHVS